MATQEQVLDPNLLEMDLDAIEDLPPFEVPPTGHYQLKLTISAKRVNDKPNLEWNYELVSTLEKGKETDPDAKPGMKFSELAGLPKGLSFVKDKLEVLGAAFGTTKLAEIIAGAQGIMVTANVSPRIVEKDGETKIFARVKNLQVA